MRVFVAHDGKLRVRIGHETLGSESLGPWYGGTGAIRLRQVAADWFWAYRLDDHAYRGTAALPEADFWRVREHLPSARVATDLGERSRNLDVRVPDADLRMLRERVVPLSTRVARFGQDLAAVFGDFGLAPLVGAGVGLFHLGGGRFNAFRTPLRTRSGFAALEADRDMPAIAARLPSARLRREGDMSFVAVDDADLSRLLATAQDA